MLVLLQYVLNKAKYIKLIGMIIMRSHKEIKAPRLLLHFNILAKQNSSTSAISMNFHFLESFKVTALLPYPLLSKYVSL